MIKGRICRKYFPKQTKGDLTLWDENGKELFKCLTLELPDRNNQRNISCFPEGIYTVVRRYSEKYGWHLHITDVEGRGLILIHWGNFAGSDNPKTGQPDIRGCVLVGIGYLDLDGDKIDEITSSKKTFNKLMEIAGNGFELEVTQ